MQNEVDIVILPPDVDPHTDKESFDDDIIQEEFSMPLDIAGQVELHNIDDYNSEDRDEEDDIPLSSLRQTMRQGRRQGINQVSEPSWTKDHVNIDMPSTSGSKDHLVSKIRFKTSFLS